MEKGKAIKKVLEKHKEGKKMGYGGYPSKKEHDAAAERQRKRLGNKKMSEKDKENWIKKNLDLSGK